MNFDEFQSILESHIKTRVEEGAIEVVATTEPETAKPDARITG